MTGQCIPGYERIRGKGQEIPPFGRLLAIADVYDALTSHKVYKEQWNEGNVLENLKSESGKQFDPEMIEAFFASLDMIHAAARSRRFKRDYRQYLGLAIFPLHPFSEML